MNTWETSSTCKDTRVKDIRTVTNNGMITVEYKDAPSTRYWVPILKTGIIVHDNPEKYLLNRFVEKLGEAELLDGEKFTITHIYPILIDIYVHELVTNLALTALYESGKDTIPHPFIPDKFALETELATFMIKHNGGGMGINEDKVTAFLTTLVTIVEGEPTFMRERVGENYKRLGIPFCGYIGNCIDVFTGFHGDLHLILHHDIVDNIGILTERIVLNCDGAFEKWRDL